MRRALSVLPVRQTTSTSQIVDNKHVNHFYTEPLTEINTH